MSKDTMTVSIITPVYNSRQYLDRFINSIITQSYKDYELILVNDGSTDDSVDVLKEYAERDKRIIVIDNKENKGAAAARNQGLSIAQGKYIMFADSDDIVSEYWIEHLLGCLSGDELIMPICGMCNSFSDLGKKESNYSSKAIEKKELISSAVWHKIGYLVNTVFSSKVINQLELSFRTQKDKADYNEDLLFVVSYLSQVDKLCYNGYSDYGYLIHNDSFSRQITTELYFEKYAEKYDIWANFVNCYGSEGDISIVSDYYLYYFFTTLNRELNSYQSFKWILLSKQMQMCAKYSTCNNENPKIVKLIHEKRTLLLWLYLNLASIKSKLTKAD